MVVMVVAMSVCECECNDECKIYYLSQLWREKIVCVAVLLNQGRMSVQINGVGVS